MIAESGQISDLRASQLAACASEKGLPTHDERQAEAVTSEPTKVTLSSDALTEIASHVQDAQTLASLSLADKVTRDAAAPALTQKRIEEAKKAEEAKSWVGEMTAKYGKPIPEPGYPSKCPACGCKDSWRLTCNFSMRAGADVESEALCSNPKCRKTWWADC
mmetsp:Transcript_48442/g.156989  ORF Transcript_48442/g.156989 Transcript_48442/m.156989 type:complete len:162 (+) Transcript_48442:48-533(+)|eukprot:CAMPEP_0185283390 /NCGR_PEP_ID=MMETSP1363-20130426/404_1 /TAXON_ID=38817 /ORGANISM="Gephyrocapsa oceanica, Strain RCC1303" /LENGTH=161 /DNA_ID=CAMNT_0027879037 /DNA_START=41 /DNA_END=526 /DNA_ORIENTATION=+